MRCAIYSRTSTRKQSQETSIPNQIKLCTLEANKKGWSIYACYEDRESASKSGKHDKRNNFKSLMQDALDKKFDVIITKNLSRLGRNGEELIKIKSLITSRKIHLITLDNKVNSLENNISNLTKLILSCEDELDDLSERTKYGLMARALDGKFNGSNAPYGYICIDGKLIKSTDESVNVVKRIFNEYLSGMGFDSIARGLYEDDIPTPSTLAGKSNSSNEWGGSSVRVILENRNYTGDLVQNKTTTVCATSTSRIINPDNEHIVVKDSHEAIISKEMFNLVQKLIYLRRKKRPAKVSHLLSNLIYCADCGKSMTRKGKSYRCCGYIKHGKKYCSSHTVKEKYVIDEAMHNIKNIIANADDSFIIFFTSGRIEAMINSSSKELSYINSTISRLNTRKYNAQLSYLDRELTKDISDKIINDCDNELKLLNSKFESISTFISKAKNIDINNDIHAIKYLLLESIVPSSKLLNMFIDKIEISDKGEPNFYYKF